ncbi:MAG TPA: hypothetical protein VK157_03545 [Phycisphaerales bacterium]|nr:hypothetical protein [Phycisphaerales bacterium]
MKAITDNAGRSGTVDIYVAMRKLVCGLTGVDLMQVIEQTRAEMLIRDPVRLCDVVNAVCKPETDGAGVVEQVVRVCYSISAQRVIQLCNYLSSICDFEND